MNFILKNPKNWRTIIFKQSIKILEKRTSILTYLLYEPLNKTLTKHSTITSHRVQLKYVRN